MPRRKKRKKRKAARAPRVQVARICSSALSHLLAQPGESTSDLRLTLGEAVKRLWARAKARGLQEGREMRCDEAMQRLFNVRTLDMFKVSGALSEHMRGAGSSSGTSAAASSTSRSSVPSSTAPQPLLTLSPALTSLLCGSSDGRGGGNRQLTLTQAEALRRVGAYISSRRLRDETDRRKIHCDAALTEIVGKTTFTVFEAKALLARHFTPAPGAVAPGGASTAGRGTMAGDAAAARAAAAGAVAGEEEEDDEEDGEEEDSEEEDGEEEDEVDGEEAGEEAGGGQPSDVQRPDTQAAASATASSERAADGGGGAGGGERVKKRKRPPAEFICPITQEVMSDPVSTADGQTYEREAIARWLKRKKTSPLTGMTLESSILIPNHSLRKLIQENWRPA